MKLLKIGRAGQGVLTVPVIELHCDWLKMACVEAGAPLLSQFFFGPREVGRGAVRLWDCSTQSLRGSRS